MKFAPLLALWIIILSSEFSIAYSYVGPGIGITMLTALWAVIGAVVLAIAGVLLWPIRSILIRWRSSKRKGSPE